MPHDDLITNLAVVDRILSELGESVATAQAMVRSMMRQMTPLADLAAPEAMPSKIAAEPALEAADERNDAAACLAAPEPSLAAQATAGDPPSTGRHGYTPEDNKTIRRLWGVETCHEIAARLGKKSNDKSDPRRAGRALRQHAIRILGLSRDDDKQSTPAARQPQSVARPIAFGTIEPEPEPPDPAAALVISDPEPITPPTRDQLMGVGYGRGR
jgi:hypothetical protein